jgi:hypothetical protein
MRCLIFSFSSADTRSVLFSRIRSANAICSTAHVKSSKVSERNTDTSGSSSSRRRSVTVGYTVARGSAPCGGMLTSSTSLALSYANSFPARQHLALGHTTAQKLCRTPDRENTKHLAPEACPPRRTPASLVGLSCKTIQIFLMLIKMRSDIQSMPSGPQTPPPPRPTLSLTRLAVHPSPLQGPQMGLLLVRVKQHVHPPLAG